jgi:hypothetical protein
MAGPSDIGGFVIGESPIGGGSATPQPQAGMRTYGRVVTNFPPDGIGEFAIGQTQVGGTQQTYVWQEVQTDPSGANDYVFLTGLIQELKLNLGESPFWGNRGIPAGPSVIQQVAPDYYVMLFQQRYAPQFLNLTIVRVPGGVDANGKPAPTYRINATTHAGVQLEAEVPV